MVASLRKGSPQGGTRVPAPTRAARPGRGSPSRLHGTRSSAVALAQAMLDGGLHLAPGQRPACTRPGVDPAWWYAPEMADGTHSHEGAYRTTAADADHAIELCNRLCPVRQACLEWVVGVEATLGPQHVHGIAGGLDAEQRRPLVLAERAARKRVAS